MGSGTRLGECRGCHVLVHAADEGARLCPECGRTLTRALVHVGFADARRVYGEPGEPHAPPAPRPARERVFVLPCVDGHTARSKDEQRIDDWLHARGIAHEREPKLKGMRPDWRVGNVYIEYWGLASQQGYDARREEKLALYRKRRLRLVELFPEDLDRLEEKLGWLADDDAAGRVRL